MKITSKTQQQGYIDSTIEGGLKGLAVGAAILLPAGMALRRGSLYFRNLPLQLKALGAVSVIIPSMYIGAEKGGEAYSRTQWTGVGKRELEAIELRERERWERLGTSGQIADWAKRRKWALIGASWVAAMGGSFAVVSRNKYQSFTQKLVQARASAQGKSWTIGIMLIAAFISGTGVAESDTVALRPGDHSWREILEQEGYAKQLRDSPDSQREGQLKDAEVLAEPRRGD